METDARIDLASLASGGAPGGRGFGSRHRQSHASWEYTRYDISRAGEMLLCRSTNRYSIACARPGQDQDTLLGQFEFAIGKDLSEDGRTLLYDEQGVALEGELYTYVGATDGSPPVRLGPGFARDLSHDGRWVLNIHDGKLRSGQAARGGRYSFRAGNQHMASWHQTANASVWARKGKGARRTWQRRRRAVTRSGDTRGRGLSSGTLTNPVSPDARVVAVTSENRLAVFALDDGAELVSFPLEDGEEPVRWCADGRSIFVWRRGEVPARVQRFDLETGLRTPWRDYAPADRTGLVCSRSVLLTPDGTTCAYTFAYMGSELFVARGLA